MVRYSSLIQTMTVPSISVRGRSPHPPLLFYLLFYLFIFFVESTSLALFMIWLLPQAGKRKRILFSD